MTNRYVNHFLLDDLVTHGCAAVRFYTPSTASRATRCLSAARPNTAPACRGRWTSSAPATNASLAKLSDQFDTAARTRLAPEECQVLLEKAAG
jgi:hypothetical protein